MELNYRFTLAWSDDDGGYIATCPEFPTVSAFGETPSEALDEVQVALELFAESEIDEGRSLPEPQKLRTEFSGRYSLRFAKSLHARATQLAQADGISLNEWLCMAISEKAERESIVRQVTTVLTNVLATASYTLVASINREAVSTGGIQKPIRENTNPEYVFGESNYAN